MKEVSLRSRHWSVLQVFAIVVCYRGKVSSERVQGCVGSQLSLRCPQMKVIQITAVVLGDSNCRGRSCCIRDNDCTYDANANHTTDVHSRCDNKQSCTVRVLKERIPCGFRGALSYNDFERITYICIDDPRRSTTGTISMTDSTEDISRTEEITPEKEPANEDTTSSTDFQTIEDSNQNVSGHDEYVTHEDRSDNSLILPVVVSTVSLLGLVLIAIVVVVVMMRRNRRPKVSVAVEMTGNGSSDPNQTVETNENQTVSLNNGSPIYSNDRIEKSSDKGAKASETYEVPNNAVCSLADDAASRPTEDLIVLESSEPTYQVPRPNVYSLVRYVGEPECAGSTADASNVDNNVYCNVETKEPAKAAKSSAQNDYEVIILKESEYKAVKADKTIPPAQEKKKGDSPAHKTSPDSYIKFNKPSKNATAFDSPGKVGGKDKLDTSDGIPNPIYVTMSPGIPESIYANDSTLSPIGSMASTAPSTGGSETENPYCEMRSTPVSVNTQRK